MTSRRQKSRPVTLLASNAVGASRFQTVSVICIQLDVQSESDLIRGEATQRHCRLTQRRSSSGGRRTALCFTASGRSPLGSRECGDRRQITSASSGEAWVGGTLPGVMFKGNPLRSSMAHLALRGATHCETDGKTVGLGEAPRRLRGGMFQ